MGRARDPRRDQAFEIWKASGGTIDLVEIAARLGVSDGTVRGWKSKDKWEKLLNGTLQSKKRNAPNRKERSVKKLERQQPKHGPEIENEDLTDKHRFFILEYMRDFNATRAAIAVGYSKKTAYAIGWELLRKPEIQAEIKRLKEAMADELGLDVRRVINEYMKVAFADISDLLDFGQKDEPIRDDEGKPLTDPSTGEPLTYKRNFVMFRNSDEVDGTVIGEVKQGKDGVSIKLHDKMRALERLERYVGYMSEEERTRVGIMKIELQKLQGGAGATQSWADALKEIAERRKAKKAEQTAMVTSDE